MDSTLTRIDTAQVDQGLFLAHGRLEVWPQGGLLCYRAAGPFNLEMVGVLSRTLRRLEWARPPCHVAVTWWERSMLASPETLAAYEQLLRDSNEHQDFPAPLSSLWLAGPEVEGHRLMRPRWEALYRAVGRPLEFCHSEAQMLARARELLAAAGQPHA